MNVDAKCAPHARSSGIPEPATRGSARPLPDAPVGNLAGPARVLVVDDHEDVRQMLATALAIEGHRVDEAADAHDGLRRLRQTRYNLIVTDHAMPGGTGAWMLQEATRRGLLDGAAALIVTAHPDVDQFGNVAVLGKPLDLDAFLAHVRKILSPMEQPVIRSGVIGGLHTRRIELVLYVSSASPSSLQAQRNLEQILDRYDPTQVSFRICDLMTDPSSGERDRIAFTPTLVKRSPEPRIWVLGDLRNSGIVDELLGVSGARPRR
jgi:DNA-binding response OmpR family regulator